MAVLEPLRTAIDDHERAGIEAERAARRRWQAHLRRAAAMAPGGAAAIIGPPGEAALPAGFAWRVVTGSRSRAFFSAPVSDAR